MRRLALLVGASFLLAGCGGKTVLPTAQEVEGTIPTTTQATAVKGDANAGAALFKAQGCGGCHTFKPAGTNGTIGPDLDKLPQYAQDAKRGSLAEFTRESIATPTAFVQPGFQPSMPDYGQTLSDKQIADLVAYLTQG